MWSLARNCNRGDMLVHGVDTNVDNGDDNGDDDDAAVVVSQTKENEPSKYSSLNQQCL